MDRYQDLGDRIVSMVLGADAPHDRHALGHKAGELVQEFCVAAQAEELTAAEVA
jgi:hypothetical protein